MTSGRVSHVCGQEWRSVGGVKIGAGGGVLLPRSLIGQSRDTMDSTSIVNGTKDKNELI